MSKLNFSNINFTNKNIIIEIDNRLEEKSENNQTTKKNSVKNTETKKVPEISENIKLKETEETAKEMLSDANKQCEKIIEEAVNKAEEIKLKSNNEAKKIIEEANKQSLEMLENSKIELEKQITSSAKEGYEAGYKDGLEKVKEELSQKIDEFDKFCLMQGEIKQKILKSASTDIINLITNISRKVILKSIDADVIQKTIENSIKLLEKKENINVIVSEKYAKLLFDLQNDSLDKDNKLKFEDFKQFKNFNIIYNPKFEDDTLIIETPYERFDASFNSQLDVIEREILEKTQNGKIDDIEKYNNESE